MFSPTVDAYTYITRSPSQTIGYIERDRFVEKHKQGKYDYYQYEYTGTEWNKLGMIPIIRSFTGCLRAFLGAVDVITGIGLAILTQNRAKLDIAAVGARNFLYGALEVGSDIVMISSLFAFTTAGPRSLEGIFCGLMFVASVAALPSHYANTPLPDPTKRIVYAK